MSRQKPKLNPNPPLVLFAKSCLDNKPMRKNSPLPKSIGKNLRRARRGVELTQEKLAEKVNVSTSYIVFIEQGRSTPSLEVLEKIAKVLRISIKDLF